MVPVLMVAGLLVQNPADLTYDITISEADERPHVAIEVQFSGEADGTTMLRLPGFWGGEGELWNVISGMTVEGGVIAGGDDPELREISHAPNAPLIVRYTVVPDRTGPPDASRSDYYRPYVEPDYVHLIGHTILLAPEAAQRTHPVEFSISLPDGWTMASDLEHGDLTLTELRRSILVAGDFRIQSRRIGGREIRLAVRGDIGVTDDHFADQVETAVSANLDYWQAETEPYLVTVLPLVSDPGFMSIGGTNLGDSFALFLTDNPDMAIVNRTLAHEHMHSWVPGRLGGAIEGDQYDEAEGYWFSEGFNDFLTTRAGVRGGNIDGPTALGHLNQIMAANAASPWRDAPNSVIREQFWTDPFAQQLPYHRGELFGWLIDHHIRMETDGRSDLDDVFLFLQETAEDGPAPTRLVSAVQAATGVEIGALYQRHIIEGAPVFLAEDTFGACGRVITLDQPVYDYGMTGNRNEDGLFVIETVDESGPAWPAGFRPGMVVLERLEGTVGDASTDSVLRVQSEAGIQDLRYRATNGEVLRIQQIAASADVDQNAACTRLLSGENG